MSSSCPPLEEMRPITRVKIVVYLFAGLLLAVWWASAMAVWSNNHADKHAETHFFLSLAVIWSWAMIGLIWAVFFGCGRDDQIIMTGRIEVIIDDSKFNNNKYSNSAIASEKKPLLA